MGGSDGNSDGVLEEQRMSNSTNKAIVTNSEGIERSDGGCERRKGKSGGPVVESGKW